MKLSKKVKVKNPTGLHARPATMIANIVQKSRSHVTLTYHNVTVNPLSIMSVLMLAITKNSQISITVVGDDAKETMNRLVEAFDKQFRRDFS